MEEPDAKPRGRRGALPPNSASVVTMVEGISSQDPGLGATGSTIDRNASSTASSKERDSEDGSGGGSGISSTISPLKPVTSEAYGGGLYGHDDRGNSSGGAVISPTAGGQSQSVESLGEGGGTATHHQKQQQQQHHKNNPAANEYIV